MNKPTAIIGASSKQERYAYIATQRLKSHGHTVYPIGIHEGKIEDEPILINKPQLKDIHTVTLYVGSQNQAAWEDYIFSLNPKRIIFNPGTENPDFEKRAKEKGIESIEACTLVLLSIDQY
ncbi:CoA-binding protein [Aurantibacillus circumpalustris]|uniref:CoA-binding protein n=1 Tax=Aurantibacillus circumpalustris TaxID=3036359 RepID=UPI00295B1128|nr:CoA-binding protein [Aurantibacillus circumpalustris]